MRPVKRTRFRSIGGTTYPMSGVNVVLGRGRPQRHCSLGIAFAVSLISTAMKQAFGETVSVYPRPRCSFVAFLGALALVIIALVSCTSPSSDPGDANLKPGGKSVGYEALGIPWWDGSVHWNRHAIEQANVASLTASADAAIFLHDRELGGAGEEQYMGRGTLTAIFDDGAVEQLSRDVVGVPLADRGGHVVAWTSLAGHHEVIVTAYDTETRTVLGTSGRLDAEGGGVFAVVGETVYYSDAKRSFAWHPREGGPAELTARTVVGGGGAGLLEMGPKRKMYLLHRDGTEQQVRTFLGSVSPDGQYVAGIDRKEQSLTVVGDLSTGQVVDLDLPDDQAAFRVRWTQDGRAVVAAVGRPHTDEDPDVADPVSNYVCEVPRGECQLIEGGPEFVWQLPEFDDSFLGVIATFFEAVGS